VVFDLCDYWLHKTEHQSAIFLAAHVINHQSKQYNLSVALRQVSTEPLLGFVFNLPLALMGMPPTQLMLTVLIILFYQF
jgi:sterol desaturase/sphingolipid hydroxylase (fatty acid hydroxylase superfamily)